MERQKDKSVSEAQLEAHRRVVNAFPDGKFKEFLQKFEGLQKTASQGNEIIYNLQDHAWRMLKPLVIAAFPPAKLVPDKPVSKLVVKGTEVVGKGYESAIKSTIQGVEKVKEKFAKKK